MQKQERASLKSVSVAPFYIGVSGHQQLGDESTSLFVSQQFREILLWYKAQKQLITVYAALALGADRLFVQIALALNVPVEIVLPCADYETLFESPHGQSEYARLLHASQAQHYISTQPCSNDAFLAAGHWIVNHSDVIVLAWNGQPPRGRGGTGDLASYARYISCPLIHLDTKEQTVKRYGDFSTKRLHPLPAAAKKEFTVFEQEVYRGSTLSIMQYHLHMPDGKDIVRDILERPESLLILPVGQDDIVLLIEEYDFGADTWQLSLPGGKIEHTSYEELHEHAQRELRQETGYKALRFEKLVDFYSHPGYISHRVHTFTAHNLVWDPLALEVREEIKLHTYTLRDALAETLIDNRFDPEAALVLWLYAQRVFKLSV